METALHQHCRSVLLPRARKMVKGKEGTMSTAVRIYRGSKIRHLLSDDAVVPLAGRGGAEINIDRCHVSTSELPIWYTVWYNSNMGARPVIHGTMRQNHFRKKLLFKIIARLLSLLTNWCRYGGTASTHENTCTWSSESDSVNTHVDKKVPAQLKIEVLSTIHILLQLD